MINCILSALLCTCPFYSFYVFMIIIFKIANAQSENSKLLDSSKEETWINKMDFFFEVIYSNIVYWVVGFFFILVFVLSAMNSKVNINLEYFCSSNLLRLQKYTIEFFVNIILAVIGSVAVFYSLNKKYYVIFSFNDIMKVLKIKEKVILIVLYYIFLCICCSVYYFNYYSHFSGPYYSIVQTTFFMLFVYWMLLLLFKLFKFCVSLYKFIFSNKTEHKMLDSLYLKMNKSDGNNFIINNYDDVKGSLKYLLNKKKSYLKVQNSSIRFVNFNNEYKCFDFKIKIKMYFTMLFWSTIISTVFLLIFSSRLEIIKFNIYSLLFSFILNVVLCVVIFINPFRKVSLHILMWSNGFSVKLDETIFYSSTLKNRFTCKKCDEYFRNLYCIVCLFKYVLNINEQASIDFINDLVEDSKLDDYLLYALCMYFYYDKYKFKKSNKYLSENFKKICDGQNINYKIACNNVLEVLKDIDGDYKKNLFNCYVGNVKCIKVHTKKKY